MENSFRKHHWKFFQDEGCDTFINVYEEREGDVIGMFYQYGFDELKEKIEDYSEDELYDFICSNIEWF